jgi:hypothetical protein
VQHEPRRLDQRAAFLPCGSHHLCCELSSSFGPEPVLTNDRGSHKKMASQKLCKISHLSTCPSLDHPPDSPVHSKQSETIRSHFINRSQRQACLGIKPEHLISKKKRQHVAQRLVQNKNCMKQFAILYHVSAEEDGKVVLQTADDRHPGKDAEQPHQHDQDGDDPAWAQVFPHCAATVQ